MLWTLDEAGTTGRQELMGETPGDGHEQTHKQTHNTCSIIHSLNKHNCFTKRTSEGILLLQLRMTGIQCCSSSAELTFTAVCSAHLIICLSVLVLACGGQQMLGECGVSFPTGAGGTHRLDGASPLGHCWQPHCSAAWCTKSVNKHIKESSVIQGLIHYWCF